MTKGRFPEKALAAAMKVAETRGLVRVYERGPGNGPTFTIASPALLAVVKIKRMRYINCTVQWLGRDAGDEIAEMKMYPDCPEISREIWICSPKYFLRFFRLCDTGLIELGPNGLPLPPGTRKGRWRPPVITPVPVPAPAQVPVPDGIPAAGPDTPSGDPPSPGQG